MATMKVSSKGSAAASNGKPPRMIIENVNGFRYVVYYSPRETSHSNDGMEWSASNRTGRRSVLRRSGEKTPTFSVSIILGHRDWHKSVAGDLQHFINFSKHTTPLKITYSKNESGWFYITDFSYNVNLRSPQTNEPTRVTMDITFTLAPSSAVQKGPVASSTAKPAPKKPPVKKAAPKAVRTHTVKRGDTLWAIAQRVYGDGTKWPKIADANGVTNPRTLQIGKVLKLPA